VTSLHIVTPAATETLVSSKVAAIKSAWSKTLDWDALFASSLAAPAALTSITQLTSVLQNGTSLATIADRVSSSVAASVQQKLAAMLPQSDADRIASQLKTSLANALAPPGHGPPGTAEQQATALASRLRSWIANLANLANEQTGQQNVISGSVLDANSAKETPAQQTTNTPPTPVDAASLSDALLNSTASALTQTVTAQTAQTAANAPDLLARMLVRAASVDANVNGAAAAESAKANVNASSGMQSPSTLAARFTAALAESFAVSASNAPQDPSSGDSTNHGNENSAADVSQSPVTQAQTTKTSPSDPLGGAAATPVISLQPQNAAPVAPATASALNADAVVQQMVKAMSLRSTQDGASEIRLQLQPENLGTVTMKLTVAGTQITANVIAQNAEVGSTLVANHQQLVRALASAGLTLSGFSVDVSGGDAGNGQNKDRTAGFGRRYVVHELGETNASETPALSSLGPQLLPGSNLELFNYLA
jgi:flagellar hook-length control protein FliK